MGIYAIGNLGSKIITFAMVPLYTFFVKDTGDYGYYDLCLTMVLLLLMPATMQLTDGAFRFLIDRNNLNDHKRTITFTYITLLCTGVAFLIITSIIDFFFDVKYVWLTYLLLMAMSVFEVMLRVARGLERKQEFVTASILSAFGIGIFSIIFVVCLRMGVVGIFWGNILARIIAYLYLDFKIGLLKTYFDLKTEYWHIGKKILYYCVPLIPGMICWWLASSSDRFFISTYLGVNINGIYAVAVRFTGIIYTFTTIFYQAWQETAIKQYQSKDRDQFFSQMANTFIFFLAFLFINYNIALKIFYPYIVDNNYAESIYYILPLCISALFFSMTQFLDMGYQCSKETLLIIPSYALTAFINVTLNYILIKQLGLSGAAISINVSFLVLFIYRYVDTRRFFKIRINGSSIVAIVMIGLTAIPFYWWNSAWYLIAFLIAGNLVLLVAMPASIRQDLLGKLLKRKQ
ncbi:MAG: polysaccharide biosynthesis C-terminal domain-containing protein [Muribaculaceae bacterium]|nr:polysaccharide biosynthesis C-terminal domain-containing protein [Muribaculaceae bacterium]